MVFNKRLFLAICFIVGIVGVSLKMQAMELHIRTGEKSKIPSKLNSMSVNGILAGACGFASWKSLVPAAIRWTTGANKSLAKLEFAGGLVFGVLAIKFGWRFARKLMNKGNPTKELVYTIPFDKK